MSVPLTSQDLLDLAHDVLFLDTPAGMVSGIEIMIFRSTMTRIAQAIVHRAQEVERRGGGER